MNPILAVGYIFNLIIINGTYGLVGIILTLGISALIYYSLSQNAGDNKKFMAQITALAVGFLAGTISIMNASWATEGFTIAALILEPLVFSLFLAIGKR